MSSDGQTAFTILMPVYDDWEALGLLLERLDSVLSDQMMLARVLIVDDGSTCEPLVDLSGHRYHALEAVHVLRIRRNLGHQAQLQSGWPISNITLPPVFSLSWTATARTIREMSRGWSSGAASKGIPRLSSPSGLIEASLRSSASSTGFTNLPTECLPAARSGTATSAPCLGRHWRAWWWFRSCGTTTRQPCSKRGCRMSPSPHGARRLSGRSRMNFISLVTHGLGALSVESETIGVRMLVASLVLIGCLVLALLATVAIRLGTGLAIPGWATTAAGLLLILLAQTLMLTVLFSFITLAGRLGMQFLPCRDCAFFVGRIYQLGSNHE